MARVTLVKTLRGCAIAEWEDRYDVMLDGQLFDQLYFNMTGYVGYLPSATTGVKHTIGERGVSAYKSEVARLNREFTELGAGRTVRDRSDEHPKKNSP